MKMFLEVLIRLGVFKVLLLLVAILWILGRLGPRWALYVESTQLTGFLQGVCSPPHYNWICFNMCPKKRFACTLIYTLAILGKVFEPYHKPHNNTKQLRDDLRLKYSYNSQILVEKYTTRIISIFYKHGMWKLEENDVHVIPSPMECNQGVVWCYATLLLCIFDYLLLT